MRVCVVGSGAREHALALALARVAPVVIAPGSAAMASRDEPHPITITTAPADEIEADLYVIGPEAPLVAGLADELRRAGRLVLGPGAAGARLEGSKAYMKELAAAAGVPTAAFATFTDASAATAHLERVPGPYVVKTDGLAAGKGVLVTDDLAAAVADVRAKLDGSAFGEAGRRVVIEEYLPGSELSLLVLTDGASGGMGAYAPVPLAGGTVETIMASIVEPTLAELRRRGIDYRGVLYAGCMLTESGPRLVEFNVRFGDPETEVVLPLIDDDVAELFLQAADGRLDHAPRVASGAALCAVLAAEGYPTDPRPGVEIRGLANAESIEGVRVLHAGTTVRDGRCYSAGGRALVVRAVGADLAEAHERCYRAVDEIEFPGAVLRRDIGAEAIGAATTGVRS